MATIINNPGTTSKSDNSLGVIMAVIIVAAILFLFFAYGLPAIRNTGNGTNINVPEKVQIDVNSNTNK